MSHLSPRIAVRPSQREYDVSMNPVGEEDHALHQLMTSAASQI